MSFTQWGIEPLIFPCFSGIVYLIIKPLPCAEIIWVPVSREMTVWATQWQRSWTSAVTKDEVVIKEGIKKNLTLNLFMTSFPHDVSHEVFCQFSFHLADLNHYYFTVIVRKGNYCHSKSYVVTWLGWGWNAEVSGVCLGLPLPSTYLYWLIITETLCLRMERSVGTQKLVKREEEENGRVDMAFASLPPSLRDWFRTLMVETMGLEAGGVVFFRWKNPGTGWQFIAHVPISNKWTTVIERLTVAKISSGDIFLT